MAIRILCKSPELTLIFDRWSSRLSTEQIALLSQTLSHVDGVESVHPRTAWFKSPRISVVFDSETQPDEILRRMASALRSLTTEAVSRSTQSGSRALSNSEFNFAEVLSKNLSPRIETTSINHLDPLLPGPRSLRHRMRELNYGILTLASFGMAWVGLIVPGIPTVPFVLLTAHFALQASPKLRARVMKSKMFGQMIRDWQEFGAISRRVQIEAYLLTLVIIVVGIIFSPPIPIVYAGMAFGSVLGLYAVSQIPVIDSTEEGNAIVKTGGFLRNFPTGA